MEAGGAERIPAGAQQPYAQPPIRGKAGGQSGAELVSTLFLPAPLRIARVLWHAVPFLRKGLRCLRQNKIKVELLDAVSIGLSIILRWVFCHGGFGHVPTGAGRAS